MGEITKDKLIEIGKVLNETKLAKQKVKTVAISFENLVENFLSTVESISEDNEGDIPAEVIKVYNKLVEEAGEPKTEEEQRIEEIIEDEDKEIKEIIENEEGEEKMAKEKSKKETPKKEKKAPEKKAPEKKAPEKKAPEKKEKKAPMKREEKTTSGRRVVERKVTAMSTVRDAVTKNKKISVEEIVKILKAAKLTCEEASIKKERSKILKRLG